MRPNCAPLLAALTLVACHAYRPAPVDLAAHARSFAARVPTTLDGAPRAVGAGDGLDRRQGRLVAMLFHPACRLARARAGLAEVARQHAGSMPDPVLDADCRRILASVPNRWITAVGVAFTLPLNGRLELERQLAAAQVDTAMLTAATTQLEIADNLDVAWV